MRKNTEPLFDLDILNPDDADTWDGRYRKLYAVGFEGASGYVGVFANTNNYSEIIDIIIDYAEKNAPGWLLTDEYVEELKRDAVVQGYDEMDFLGDVAVCGGDNNRWLDVNYGIQINDIECNKK